MRVLLQRLPGRLWQWANRHTRAADSAAYDAACYGNADSVPNAIPDADGDEHCHANADKLANRYRNQYCNADGNAHANDD